MSHNIGQMFYVGERPWHGLGKHCRAPLALDDAIAESGLNYTYKGFPICQARGIHRAAQRLDSFVVSALQPDYFTALMRIASSLRDKVRTDKLQPVIDAALLVAEPGCGP